MNYRAFVQAVNAISATGILEMAAQVKTAKFTAADGSEQEVPNLIADYVRGVINPTTGFLSDLRCREF